MLAGYDAIRVYSTNAKSTVCQHYYVQCNVQCNVQYPCHYMKQKKKKEKPYHPCVRVLRVRANPNDGP